VSNGICSQSQGGYVFNDGSDCSLSPKLKESIIHYISIYFDVIFG